MTDNIEPTRAQRQALGILAVYGRVWADYEVSIRDLHKLERLGLCLADPQLPFACDATDKFKALLGPYQQIIAEHRKVYGYLRDIEARIHPYYGSQSYYQKPTDLDERDQLSLVKARNDAAALMTELRQSVGDSLARHWMQWVSEVTVETL